MLDWFKRAFAQDDFAGDWYGWLTNQIGHIGLGIFAALLVSQVYFQIAGEFPYKWLAWLGICAAYIGSEVWRGWSGGDSIEDSVFVLVYGAGGSLLLFSEVAVGKPLLIVSSSDIMPILGIALAHMGAGVWKRA